MLAELSAATRELLATRDFIHTSEKQWAELPILCRLELSSSMQITPVYWLREDWKSIPEASAN